MEAQSLQLSIEQTAASSASTSCIPATISANYLSAATEAGPQSMDNSNQMMSSTSSSPSSASSVVVTPAAPLPPQRAGKTRATRKTKPRTSPYPVSPSVANQSVNQNGGIIPEPVVQHASTDDYSNPMMDYRYDMQQTTSNPAGYHVPPAMYPAYSGNEVTLYNYAANGVVEAGNSASSHSDLYNPYYETDNLAAYPTPLRHYPTMTEGNYQLIGICITTKG